MKSQINEKKIKYDEEFYRRATIIGRFDADSCILYLHTNTASDDKDLRYLVENYKFFICKSLFS